MRPTCEQPGCKSPAVFKVYRADKIAPKLFCSGHLAEKVGKYELRAERLK